jgi:hypothetical protein
MNDLDFIQQLLQLQQNGAPFLGSTTQYRSPITASSIMPGVQAAMGGLTGVGSAAGAASGAAGAASGAAGAASGLATAMPFIGLGLTAISTIMSMSEAGKAADAQRAAEREAERKVLEATRLKEQNAYAAKQVPVQAYERAFRENTAASSEAINRLAQDQRSLIGGVQGVQEATIEGQAQNTERLADRLYNKAMTDAGAEMAINQDLSKLYLDQAQGASVAAMAAEKAKIAQQQAMLQGVGGIITQGLGAINTYGTGISTPEDKIQGLLGGTAFARPAAQPNQAQLLQMLSQNPNILMQLLGQQKSTIV